MSEPAPPASTPPTNPLKSGAPAAAPISSGVRWMILVIAAIGFAFDIYELLMLPLILRPALMELGGIKPGTPEFGFWFGLMFYVPAFAGGLFGLLGGYITDLFGRRRVLTWSILLYAFSAFFAGFATSLPMLLALRCTCFIGVCVEFVAAVAWLAELYDDPHARESALGYTQAFSSIGGLLVAGANGLAVAYAASLPAIPLPEGYGFDPHAAWRYTLMSGLIPAIPLIVIRPFLPESPGWAAKKAAGTLRRPSFGELFAPGLRTTTIVTTLMFACGYGAAFGAIQQVPQIVPGLPEVREKVEAEKAVPKKRAIEQAVASDVTKVQEIGGLFGRFALAALVVRIASRRTLLWVFQVPGLFVVPAVFAWAAVTGLNHLYVGIFLAGFFTVAQFSFWGNYLPAAYPLHLRGTGESFAANIGGRLIGTCFAAVTGFIASNPLFGIDPFPGADTPTRFAYTSACVALFVYAVGVGLSFFLPEPGPERDDDGAAPTAPGSDHRVEGKA
jgi:MFS family permease